MLRRLFVCMTVLGCWLLLGARKMEAQCGPNPCYTVNPPVYVHLTPAQAAAQGAVTTTYTIQATNVNGALVSKNITATPGTMVGTSWTSNNANSVSWWYTVNNDQTHLGPGSGAPPNGSNPNGWLVQSNQIGNIYHLFIQANGNGTSTDYVNLTVVSGSGPAIVFQDGVPSNTYVQINTSGGGGSMAADFVECQAGQIHQCINATHTPYSQVLITNPATGDSLFHSKHVAGNMARYNEQVSYGDSLCCISMLNEDVLQFREDDEVDCSVAGPVPPAPKHKDVQFGMKITYTWVSALVKSNGMHPQAPYCSEASKPPDWPGPFEASPNTKSGEYAGAEEMYREVDAGQSFTGVPWSWWFSYFSEPYIYPTDPFPPNCTNTDKGFKNGVNVFWPLPGLPF